MVTVWWRHPWVVIGGGIVAAALVVAVVVVAIGGLSPAAEPSATPAPEVQLASVDTAASGATVDGIVCQHTQQRLYHVHAHLAVFVNGQPRSVPAGIGIAPPRSQTTPPNVYVNGGSCIYWLNTHTGDGIINVEAPAVRRYTLGNFFDIWQQPLSTTQVGPAQGRLYIYVDGRLYTGTPRAIPIDEKTVIQISVGTDVGPRPYTFPAGL